MMPRPKMLNRGVAADACESIKHYIKSEIGRMERGSPAVGDAQWIIGFYLRVNLLPWLERRRVNLLPWLERRAPRASKKKGGLGER